MFSFPIIMWVMELGFWQVLIMDIGAVMLFLFYAILFNWLYDIIRHTCFSSNPF